MQNSVINKYKDCKSEMVKQVSKLDTLSPLKTLTRGYCIAEQKDGMIKSVNDIKKEDEVLEIGSGMGAVTGALARNCKKVDCIELSKRRSLANAYRNKSYNNIEIFRC